MNDWTADAANAAGGRLDQRQSAAIAMAKDRAALTHGITARRDRRVNGATAVGGSLAGVKRLSVNHRRGRWTSGFFDRHVRIIASNAGWATWAELAARGAGSCSGTAAITLAGVSTPKARRPVIISYSTYPKPNTSVRESASAPCSCSGAM
jgi:hypothetical protein